MSHATDVHGQAASLILGTLLKKRRMMLGGFILGFFLGGRGLFACLGYWAFAGEVGFVCLFWFHLLVLVFLFHLLFFLSSSFFSFSKTKFNIKLAGFGVDPQHAHSPVLIGELDCWLTVFHKDQIHICKQPCRFSHQTWDWFLPAKVTCPRASTW